MTWDMLLTFVGLAGIWLAGSKRKVGWAIGVSVQVLWVVYALDTDQEWFVLSAVAYATLYGRNWWRWRREERRRVPPVPIEDVVDGYRDGYKIDEFDPARIVWVVCQPNRDDGQYVREWELGGVFTSEELAAAACTGPEDSYWSTPLDHAWPHDTIPVRGRTPG
jgi:hypothetical protein